MTGLHDNILGTIGGTPVVRLNKLAPKGVNIYAKLEAFNPLGSVKDRLALAVIEAAERDGSLKPGQTVIEATSGNTGIGLAMVCAQKGYPLVIVMAESFSVERRKLMRFLGAKVILTPAAAKGSGMVAKARELADKHGWFFCHQFENQANADMHSRTTAQEILQDFAEVKLDYWVTGSGTGGTLQGVSRVLKEQSPDTKIVLCEPDNAPMIAGDVAQAYNDDGTPAESHPLFRPHLMQGWAPDFVPKLAHDALTANRVDRIVPIDGNAALRLSRELATKEGIFCGISAGATLAGALKVAETAPEGCNILFMAPDTGERYLSTPLFENIPEVMTPEEVQIATSTENFVIGVNPAPAPAPAAKADPIVLPEVPPMVAQFVDETINDPEMPVVLFALEWCEFSWAIRKFFTEFDIPFRSVDLDSVAYQKGNLGGDIRKDLFRRIGQPTIPQVFVGGRHIGGCTETLDYFKDGKLQDLLTEHSIAFRRDLSSDPYSFLPKWVHPR